MITTSTVYSITINHWKNKIPTGTIIAAYYTSKSKLPKRHEGATLKRFGSSLLYIDSEGNKLIKNAKNVGKKEYWTLNGQQFYSANMHFTKRLMIKNSYSKYFKPYINAAFKSPFVIFLDFKLSMHVEIFEVFSSKTPDITNMWILPKLFEDSMVTEGILADDSPEYRKGTSFSYTFVEKEEDRKLVITFKYEKN